jgi:protein SCO1/2
VRAVATIVGLALLASSAAGCGRRHSVYEARGVVESVNREYGQVVIAHEDIPGLMPAMTMNFDVPDPALLATLEPGQAIDFEIEFTGRAYRVVAARPRGEGGRGHGPEGASVDDLVAERDPAPAFELVDQDGNPFALASLRGKAVLLDFVYTQCPGPCPILTGLHVDVQRALDPALRARTHFVSISLDPVRDTPAALREYARKRGADTTDWTFVTGPPEEVARVIGAYGVGSARQPDGTIAHLVATFLIDGEGRVAQRLVGLEHEVDEVVRGLARIAPAPGAEAAPAAARP